MRSGLITFGLLDPKMFAEWHMNVVFRFGRVIALIVATHLSAQLRAQCLKHPTTGIPRTADGRADLTAAVPRTAEGKPDLTGVWRWNPGGYGTDVILDVPPEDIQPWAVALVKQRRQSLAKHDSANMQCRPQGRRANLVPFNLGKIIQTPQVLVFLSEDMSFRQVFTDGRSLPDDPNPSWMGYSVGRWDDDMLVVESVGFNHRTWPDFIGHPHTDNAR